MESPFGNVVRVCKWESVQQILLRPRWLLEYIELSDKGRGCVDVNALSVCLSYILNRAALAKRVHWHKRALLGAELNDIR